MEAGIYKKLYERKDYRAWSPGEELVTTFLNVAKPRSHETLIDFGCGSGRAAKKLSEHCQVSAVDFADNAIETDVPFKVHDLREPFDLEKPYDYGFCTDVMEHIAPEDVKKVLGNILKASRKVFFQISTRDDDYSEEAGTKLHLTVKPMSWWVQQFEAFNCEVKWAKQAHDAVLFYVTAYLNWQHVACKALLHDEDVINQNIRENLRQGYTEVKLHDKQDVEIMLLAGGPSLSQFEDDIRYRHKHENMPIVTTNGTYNWCLERGLKPAAQIIVDARKLNQRFLEPIIPGCKYLLSSQCHPDLLKSVPKEQLFVWHTSAAMEPIEELYGEGEPHTWFPILGGSTVMLRAFPLLQLLGFYKYHVYGFDSCLMDGKHHSYSQPENDQEKIVDIEVGGKWFSCHYWMAVQAREYMEEVKRMLQECEMSVYGPGLIAHILTTGAELSLGD
jgi:SAM-dependent methyltransferase